MIRVLHFGLSPSLGGIETYLKKVTYHINKNKFQFDFLVMGDEKPCWYDDFITMGSQFYSVIKRSKNPIKSKKQLIDLFEKEKFDIVHCHLNSLSNILPVKIALKYNNVVIVHSRNSKTSNSLKTKLFHFINSFRLPKNRIVKVAVSELAGKWMFGQKADFIVINNGIDVEKFKYSSESRIKTRKELGIYDKFCVTNIGAFRHQKNHMFLLEVFKHVSQIKHNSVLLLIGTGELERKIISKARKLGISDKLLMLGNRNDVSDLLSASDVFLFPSHYEGFPNVVLEAQTSGLSCLISDTITSEVVLNRNCEMFSLKKSSKEWALKLLSLDCLEDRKKSAEEIKKKGFSVNDEIKKLENMYLQSLKNHNI